MKITILACFLAVAFCYTSSALRANSALLHTFNDPTVTDDGWFGYSTALDGNFVLIGAPFDSAHGYRVGQAHLFDATTGSLLRTFNSPSLARQANFGKSVALDGNHALIGAEGAEQAYLFDTTTGSLLRTFNSPSLAKFDSFGKSVALDGNHALIGAPFDDTQGDDVGQAHLFNTTTGSLLHTFDDPTVTEMDLFGDSVALDGNYVLVGASKHVIDLNYIGQAHLFDATTGNLLHTFDDPTPYFDDRFSYSLALDGNQVLIGDPFDWTHGDSVGQAHLFDAITGSLLRTFDSPTLTDYDNFGWSVALDGNHALVGAIGAGLAGQAYLIDATTGSLLRAFDDPTFTRNDNFGWSVALDGNHALIGVPFDDTHGDNVGQAHLFDITVPEPRTTFLLLGMGIIVCTGRWRQVSTNSPKPSPLFGQGPGSSGTNDAHSWPKHETVAKRF